MEEKNIVITQNAENTIIGQQSTFGWQLKDKINHSKFLFLKFNSYTLVRDRNDEEVTQTQKNIEIKYDDAFDTWSHFMLNGFKLCNLSIIISYVVIILGVILMVIGDSKIDINTTELPTEFIIGLVIILLSIIVLGICAFINYKKGVKPVKEMDNIANEMRQVNLIRRKK